MKPSSPRALVRTLGLALGLAVLASGVSCKPVGGERYSRKQAQKSLKKLETPGLVLGEFRPTKVVDGDTIHVDGLDASLRLVGIDAEETFKSESDRRAAEAGWEAFLAMKKGDSKRPVKAPSPMGEVAKKWGQQWFEGVKIVRVERDHPAEIRDRYNRYLAYAIGLKNGQWLNYNVELVRAGMSPYFPKYGYSRRFHAEFMEAQAQAKAAKRGIWDPKQMAYPDYPQRETWWMARGAFVHAFRQEAEGKPNYVDLTHFSAMKVLEEHVGKEVHVLSTIDDISIGQRGPTRVTLSSAQRFGFPLIFFDKDLLASSGILEWRGEFVVVTGVPTIYENKNTHKKQLQIVVDRASQVRLSPIPGLEPPAAVPTTASP